MPLAVLYIVLFDAYASNGLQDQWLQIEHGDEDDIVAGRRGGQPQRDDANCDAERFPLESQPHAFAIDMASSLLRLCYRRAQVHQ